VREREDKDIHYICDNKNLWVRKEIRGKYILKMFVEE
jgi:hypothetical protein